jgi:hypothetical protein
MRPQLQAAIRLPHELVRRDSAERGRSAVRVLALRTPLGRADEAFRLSRLLLLA